MDRRTTRFLLGRAIHAVPLALCLPVGVASFSLLDAPPGPLIQSVPDALARAIAGVGFASPLLAITIATVSLQRSRAWLALQSTGWSSTQILSPLLAVGVTFAVALAALAMWLPEVSIGGSAPPVPVSDAGAWLLPFAEGTVRFDVGSMALSDAPTLPGRPGASSRSGVLIFSLALLAWAPAIGSQPRQIEPSVSRATGFFLLVASLAVVVRTLADLLAQAGIADILVAHGVGAGLLAVVAAATWAALSQ